MTKYTKPEINVINFAAGDIIQTSGYMVDGGEGGGNGTIHFPEPNSTTGADTMSVFDN